MKLPLIVIVLWNSNLTLAHEEKDVLVLVHVLFRHGHRTPNGPDELYPTDPYRNETYFPYGLGQLTNVGKIREYSIGKTLRQRYDKFLGPYYYPEIVEAQSTDYNRTKNSLQLVLAGLFPPKGELVWNNELLWQPIPYNYQSSSQDKVLLGVNCPNYLKLYDEYIKSGQYQTPRKTFEYISKNTGLNVTLYRDVYNLYFGLSTEEEWGFKLPEWTKEVWPKVITELAIQEYFTATATPDLKRMASGYLLEKIISDTKSKIAGNNKGRKIYLYSAHESNIAHLLITLGVFDPPHIPNYGSYVIFEIRQYYRAYGITIYYENYTTKKLQLLKLPGCGMVCCLNKFINLMDKYMPTPGLCSNINC